MRPSATPDRLLGMDTQTPTRELYNRGYRVACVLAQWSLVTQGNLLLKLDYLALTKQGGVDNGIWGTRTPEREGIELIFADSVQEYIQPYFKALRALEEERLASVDEIHHAVAIVLGVRYQSYSKYIDFNRLSKDEHKAFSKALEEIGLSYWVLRQTEDEALEGVLLPFIEARATQILTLYSTTL